MDSCLVWLRSCWSLFPEAAGYRDALIFVLLVVILLVKPTGLFGEKTSR